MTGLPRAGIAAGDKQKGKYPRCVAMRIAPAYAGIRRIATLRDPC
jgi:hypothetical protein